MNFPSEWKNRKLEKFNSGAQFVCIQLTVSNFVLHFPYQPERLVEVPLLMTLVPSEVSSVIKIDC